MVSTAACKPRFSLGCVFLTPTALCFAEEELARQLYELVLPGLEKALGAKHLTTLTAHLNRAEHVVETWSALQPLNLT